jgi:hypothetical protein
MDLFKVLRRSRQNTAQRGRPNSLPLLRRGLLVAELPEQLDQVTRVKTGRTGRLVIFKAGSHCLLSLRLLEPPGRELIRVCLEASLRRRTESCWPPSALRCGIRMALRPRLRFGLVNRHSYAEAPSGAFVVQVPR